ncbi:MAG: GtrA family protein, partial [Leuconostoc sp.]|uniref:GtrA family protein n=1 Tax=Leuconostoc sp. TaxID=1930076 RepID=UPI0039EAF370
MTRIKNLMTQYQDVILYIIFGVLTTVVNIIVFTLFYNFLHSGHNIAYVVEWFFAVLFAYLKKRPWVFNSTHTNSAAII